VTRCPRVPSSRQTVLDHAPRGFELTVGKLKWSPRWSTQVARARRARLHHVHEEFVGAVTDPVATERHHDRHGQPQYRLVRLEWHSRARLSGIRTDFMTETRGGGICTRTSTVTSRGSATSDCARRRAGGGPSGPTTANALIDLESRASCSSHLVRGLRGKMIVVRTHARTR